MLNQSIQPLSHGGGGSSLWRSLWVPALVAVFGYGEAGCAGAGAGAGTGRWDTPALMRALRNDLKPPGKKFVLATYGAANPACWTLASAPVKPRRRLRRLIAQGVSAQVRMCQVEYVRRGTHDDILVKIFVLQSPAAARQALATPFLRGRHNRLARHGLPPPRRVGNVVFYVIGSAVNKEAVRKVHAAVRARLAR